MMQQQDLQPQTEVQIDNQVPAYASQVPQDQTAILPTIPTVDQVIDQTVATERARLATKESAFEFQQRRARMFARSGLFSSSKDLTADIAIAQAMVRIELGESLGFSPAESMMYIDVISGRPAISAAARAARMQAAGYSWSIQWHEQGGECVGCTIYPSYRGVAIKDHGGKPAAVSYLRSDAERMLTTVWDDKTKTKRRASVLEKDNWRMTPRNMYFSRAITNTQRWYAPGVLNPALLSVEEAVDVDQDATEAPGRERGGIDIASLKPGASANRGHDATGLESIA